MRKKIKLSESQLKKLINENVNKILKEGVWDEHPYVKYENAIKACGSIIYKNEAHGRSFAEREIGSLASDDEFMKLEGEVMSYMEGYFNAAKDLLSYTVQKLQQDEELDDETKEHLTNKANMWLDITFKPTWKTK